MTCSHCVSAITKATTAVDAGAKVRIDLSTHRVEIESSTKDAAEFSDAIRNAGYTPAALESTAGPKDHGR